MWFWAFYSRIWSFCRNFLTPEYFHDDSWFGPAVLSEKQMTIQEAYEHAVYERLVLQDNDTVEPKDIHETIYRITTSSGKTAALTDSN